MSAKFTQSIQTLLRRRGGIWIWGGLLLLCVVLVLSAAALSRTLQQHKPDATAATAAEAAEAAKAADPNAIAALMQRCQNEMRRGTCSAMNANPPASTSARLFIAGVGEVDAAAFTALRAAGKQMCEDAAAACRQDWNGNTCRITRALYPVQTASAPSTK
ncbi:MAG: hypothetical protein H7143_04775 [Pseudorhodobacter sp.]|nr:hypothetical protein [Rhizobacter sp.]